MKIFANRKYKLPAWAAAGLVTTLARGAYAEDTGSLCSDWADAVAVDVWNRTWVGGTAADNRILEWETGHAHFGDFAIARLARNGQPDNSFGDSGTVVLDEGDFDSVADIALSWNGAVVAGTTAQQLGHRSGPQDVVVTKLRDNGDYETGFGTDGVVRIDLGGSEQVVSVAAGWLGEVYVAGTIESDDRPAEAFLLRLARDGKVDTTFGRRGWVRLGELAGMERAYGMRMVEGGFVVGGQGAIAGGALAMVVRLTAQGHLDRRFGVQGVASADVGATEAADGAAFFSPRGAAALSLPVVTPEGDTQVATVLFDKRGSLLPSADGAPFRLDAPSGTQDAPSAGAFFWGRTLYLAGATYPDDFAMGDAFVTRTSIGGIVDPEFAGGPITEHFYLEYAAFNDLALTPGTVTVAGWNFGEADTTLPPSDALVVRYRHDGTRDLSFGDHGVVMLDFMHGQAVCGPRVEVE